MSLMGMSGSGAGVSSGIDTGDIANSVRFRASNSAYLSRTFGTPTDNAKWTWSGWVKRGALGTDQAIISAGTTTSNDSVLHFRADGRLEMYAPSSGGSLNTYTLAVFRDPTAHFHLHVIFDSANGVSTNRFQIWINNVRQSFSPNTQPSAAISFNGNGIIHHVGRLAAFNSEHLDGYLSRICFVDGQALTPSSFIEFNTTINEWVSKSQSEVKAVVDAGGTNSFMLDFDDATSTTTLGYDKSSKGNNWTLNNISLTAGVTYDHVLDVPGNSYATLNPLRTFGGTLSSANLGFTSGNSGSTLYGVVTSTFGVPTTGKHYFEVIPSTVGEMAVGVTKAFPTSAGDSRTAMYYRSGEIYVNGSVFRTETAYTTNTIGVAIDTDASTIRFYRDNTAQGAAVSYTSGDLFVGIAQLSGSGSCSGNINFGQRPFAYTPPTGFLALCQENLPTPATAVLNPREHFDVKTRSGTGASATVTGIQFQGDLIWTKARNNVGSNLLTDSMRGTSKVLFSDLTNAETTPTSNDQFGGFTADGYTLNADTGGYFNKSTNTYVDWLFKAGGTGVTNTAGSITSTVSANTDLGFSIVTYTGTGANATVGHGLGVAPKMVITKGVSLSASWYVWHRGLGGDNDEIYLNATNAKATNAADYSAAPSSTVLSFGGGSGVNSLSNTFVAYCFTDTDILKTFSYTGNGSADGPYVHLGGKARWVLTKSAAGATSSWLIYDTARQTYNYGNNLELGAEGSFAEYSGTHPIDIDANGLKIRHAASGYNTNGDTYIGIAIMDVCGKFALARYRKSKCQWSEIKQEQSLSPWGWSKVTVRRSQQQQPVRTSPRATRHRTGQPRNAAGSSRTTMRPSI